MAMTYDQSGVYRFDPDQFTKTYGYDGSNNLTSITVTVDGNTFKQTLGYTSGNLTTEGPWVKQ
jgi:YD repeat-containing protein